MARMHARRKGKSGSTHMIDRKKHPDWSSLKPREIGIKLRDQFAVPDVKIATGKRISQILEDNKIHSEIPEDVKNLIRRALQIREHLETHRKDNANKRNLNLTEAKIRRLAKYYRSNEKIPTFL